MNIRNHIIALLIICSFLSPSAYVYAQQEFIPLAIPAIMKAAETIPSVPTIDTKLAAKETRLSFSLFGFSVNLPFGMDSIAISISKHILERIVDSTVTWINNGFNGNPVYVTDPKQYFTELADGVAGQFIEGSDLAFLCSPFQVQVKLALRNSVSKPKPFQCTLTEVVGNIDDFYGDFSQGGWDGWFSMTQNNSNNAYGAYLDAKIVLDSQIAEALGIKREQLSWGSGFLSTEVCDAYTVPVSLSQSGQEECVDASGNPVQKKIVTPGVAIESQLEKVLGTGVSQLELADEFDELIGALLGQLLQKTVFSAKGLFSGHEKVETAVDNTTPYTTPAESGPPTEWTWNDRGGAAYASSKCPSINPRDYFFSLIGSADINAWQQTLDSIQPSLWDCGIGEQRSSGGEARGRLYLPTAACPDASPDAADAILGVRQNPACWAHEVDVLGFTPVTNPTAPPAP